MAGMFMSNIMMFFPEMTQWVCLIGLAIFVFGIYIPYEEHKKKKKQAKKSPVEKQEPRKPVSTGESVDRMDRKRLNQLETLKKAGLLSEEEYQEKKRQMR